MTVQRRTVLEVLAGRGDHPTADQIFDEVRRRIPEISKTTVYRVLETLVRGGVAARALHSGPAARFDAITDTHDHLVCVGCGKLVDVDVPVDIPEGLVDSQGFEILDCSIYFRGLCPGCQETVGTRAKGTQDQPAPSRKES